MQAIVVDQEGTKLSYIDSGVPSSDARQSYTTIFAIHGTAFASREFNAGMYASLTVTFSCLAVFNKVAALAGQYGIRFVAINRRDYPESTPFSPSDIQVLSTGTDDEKAGFLRARGVEIATFIDRFAERNETTEVSADGKTGGFAILGWSLGCALVHAAVAHVDGLPSALKRRFSNNLRALIFEGKSSSQHIQAARSLKSPSGLPIVSIGTPIPPKAWSPHMDTTIPTELRDGFFLH